jgi:hypothetical protein
MQSGSVPLSSVSSSSARLSCSIGTRWLNRLLVTPHSPQFETRQFPNLQRSIPIPNDFIQPPVATLPVFPVMPRDADNRAIALSSSLDFVPHPAGLPVPKNTNPALSPLAIKPPSALTAKSIAYPFVLCPLNPFIHTPQNTSKARPSNLRVVKVEKTLFKVPDGSKKFFVQSARS